MVPSLPTSPKGPRTKFLRLTSQRAVLPRWRERVAALERMERLIAIQARGGKIGVEGHLLASITRAFPVSHRAMRMELYGYGYQPLVEVAEQIELRIMISLKI